MKFENFYKNVKTSKYFDKDSFIGQIVLNGIWMVELGKQKKTIKI